MFGFGHIAGKPVLAMRVLEAWVRGVCGELRDACWCICEGIAKVSRVADVVDVTGITVNTADAQLVLAKPIHTEDLTGLAFLTWPSICDLGVRGAGDVVPARVLCAVCVCGAWTEVGGVFDFEAACLVVERE
jgi:hypothetical protein